LHPALSGCGCAVFRIMTTSEYLLWHAALCRRIAEDCVDARLAHSLQEIAEMHVRRAKPEALREISGGSGEGQIGKQRHASFLNGHAVAGGNSPGPLPLFVSCNYGARITGLGRAAETLLRGSRCSRVAAALKSTKPCAADQDLHGGGRPAPHG